MACHPRVTAWSAIIHARLPALTKPHATVLALWSLGMVVARSGAWTAVSAFLATWLHRQEEPVRQQWRECCSEATAKRGESRRAVRRGWPGAWPSGRARHGPWPSLRPPGGPA